MRLLRVLALAFLFWVGTAALLSYAIAAHLPQSEPGSSSWLLVFEWTLPVVVFWTLVTPLTFAFTRRVRLDRVSLALFVFAHFAAALLAHTGAAWVEWATRPWLRPSLASQPFFTAISDGIVFDLVRYFGLVAAAHAFDFRSLYERQRHEALELKAELLEAQLAMLRLQLQPHFLFNALHAISELVYRDPRLADRAITRLADLLRGSLASGVIQESALEAELELLDAYLDIERLRAGDALTLDFDVDAATRPLAVPNLILQPLVENALRHGVRGRPRATVTIGARLLHGYVELRVEDDGSGLNGATHEGLGLRATRTRLRGLYGDDQALTLEPRADGGTVVRVRFPARVFESARGSGGGSNGGGGA